MGLSTDAYARQLQQLLPQGAAWNLEAGTTLSKLLLGLSEELARVDHRASDVLDELDPRTTLELLADWERVLGLPDGCLVQVPDAINERRALVTQKAVSIGGHTREFFVALAATLGYVITITEFRHLVAGFHAGDRCTGLDWTYAWQVTVPNATITRFVAGSYAGERLVGWGFVDLECIIARAAPAHTTVLFAYV